ncbi:unnamed protein product [Chironomus riparius]|uniref:Enhancer of split malpha protein n=1 Tax=Chironomus riparius TaxID=315576 RepID=A0A9N9S1A7_9DIPT|nr:unnamed protein product [Chironomus riparius]
MSVYSSDYSMSSINSINENIYNTQKQQKSPKYRLRKIFKPILKMLLQRKKKVCEFKKSAINDYDYSTEICDNASNETLETRIFDEIKDSNNNSAIYVFGQEEDYLMKVDKQQSFVPVHFARTETGTFFWTSFNDQGYCHQENLPQHQFHRFDRWVQA